MGINTGGLRGTLHNYIYNNDPYYHIYIYSYITGGLVNNGILDVCKYVWCDLLYSLVTFEHRHYGLF